MCGSQKGDRRGPIGQNTGPPSLHAWAHKTHNQVTCRLFHMLLPLHPQLQRKHVRDACRRRRDPMHLWGDPVVRPGSPAMATKSQKAACRRATRTDHDADAMKQVNASPVERKNPKRAKGKLESQHASQLITNCFPKLSCQLPIWNTTANAQPTKSSNQHRHQPSPPQRQRATARP